MIWGATATSRHNQTVLSAKTVNYKLKQSPVATTASGEISLENETISCPYCAETIKILAKKCRFCATELDKKEMSRLIDARKTELEDRLKKENEDKIQCPKCKRWDIYQTMTQNHGMSDYCPHCKKALLDIEMEFT